jgi:YD repeat-containing protein
MGYAYNANAQLSRIVQLQNGTETARWTLGYSDQGDVQRLTYTDATTIDPTTLAPTETTQRIPQHDAHGRPEVIVAPDGSRTRLSYNTRGALTRLVQGEAITHDARGVMTRIKTPDGSVFALVYDSDVNLTQIKHNGKAITAAYVAGLSGEVKATVAEMVETFSWVFTEEVLIALNSTSSRQQAQRERPRVLPEEPGIKRPNTCFPSGTIKRSVTRYENCNIYRISTYLDDVGCAVRVMEFSTCRISESNIINPIKIRCTPTSTATIGIRG